MAMVMSSLGSEIAIRAMGTTLMTAKRREG